MNFAVMLQGIKIKKDEKLASNLHIKMEYVIHMRNLKQT